MFFNRFWPIPMSFSRAITAVMRPVMGWPSVPGWHQGFLDGDQLIHLAGEKSHTTTAAFFRTHRNSLPCLGIPQDAPPGVGLLLREPVTKTVMTSRRWLFQRLSQVSSKNTYYLCPNAIVALTADERVHSGATLILDHVMACGHRYPAESYCYFSRNETYSSIDPCVGIHPSTPELVALPTRKPEKVDIGWWGYFRNRVYLLS